MIAPRSVLARFLRRSSVVGLGISLLLHAGAGAILYAVALPTREPVGNWVPATAQFDPQSAAAAVVPTRIVAEVSELNGNFVRTQLDAQVARQHQVTPREQLQRLEVMGQQLDRLSSPDSLDELSEQFQSWMGYAHRATQPATTTEPGEFDYATAQIFDVSRHRQPDNSWRYWCVLLDAYGRTVEVELDAEYGRTAYELLQRIKAHPLLEKVYRQIFMPLADHIRRTASHAAAEPEAAAPAN